MDETFRRGLLDWAHWQCEHCGSRNGERRDGGYATLEVHHRLIRKHGGPDTFANCVVLCGPNPAGCHGRVHANPAWAYANGLLVRSWRGAPVEHWSAASAPVE